MKYAFIFAGQGSQKPGMGKSLFDRYGHLLEKADAIAGYSIRQLCLENPSNRLNQTLYAQVALYVVNAFSYYAHVEDTGRKPDYLAGHSLGEYNALLAGDVFDFETGLRIVKKRGELFATVQGGTMAAVIGLENKTIQTVLHQSGLASIDLANLNTPTQAVISGPREAIARAERFLINAGASAYIPLNVSGPFHSRYLSEIKSAFREFLSAFNFSPAAIPVIANLTARPYGEEDLIRNMVEQITSPVRWEESIRFLRTLDTVDFIEMGDSRVLTRMIDAIPHESTSAGRMCGKKRSLAKGENEYARNARSLVDILQRRSAGQPDRRSHTFLEYMPHEQILEKHYSYADLDRRARHIGALLQERRVCDVPVMIMYPPGLEYMAAFYGCLYARAIAVPCYPPVNTSMMNTFRNIVKNAGATHALTIQPIAELIRGEIAKDGDLKSLTIIATDAIGEDLSGRYRAVDIESDAVAFLQYTSGSTSSPKGVMVSHSNMLHNSEFIYRAFGLSSETMGVGWLPPYHDMGLIGGIIQPVYGGFPVALMSPISFIKKPFRWLQAMTRYKATYSGGPNFGYDLCARKITPEEKLQLDLQHWDLACNGAEPIRIETLQRFADAFSPCGFNIKAFHQSYGLAESTLMVSCSQKWCEPYTIDVDPRQLANGIVKIGTPGPSLQHVSCGKTFVNHRVAIVQPGTVEVCPEDQVGEILVKGPSIARGYWNNERLTRELFQACLPGGDGPYLRTGDLGYLHEGNLYICGRLKDLIIINGVNHYPQDIELSAESSTLSVHKGRLVAFSIESEGKENLVVVAEYHGSGDRRTCAAIFNDIYQKVYQHHHVAIADIVLIQPRTLPVTTSGKVQRQATRTAYREGTLEVIARWKEEEATSLRGAGGYEDTVKEAIPIPASSAAIIDWLKMAIARRKNIEEAAINEYASLGTYGLSSLEVIDITGELESWLAITFPPTSFYDYPDIHSLACAIAEKYTPETAGVPQPLNPGGGSPDKIAIIGMSGFFPGADSIYDLWENLLNGTCSITEVPSDRWNWRDYETYGTGRKKSALQWGGFTNGFDSFDVDFFNIPVEEASWMDPQQRKLLEVVWHTLEDAGYDPHSLEGTKTGVFMGISSSDFKDFRKNDDAVVNAYAVTGMAHSIIANRVSYFYNFSGPSEVIDTACSSSLIAVHRAVQAIRSGECEQALAGGINILLSPLSYAAVRQAGMLSEDGKCKTFDAAANGYVRGEGCATILLKPLAKAVADGDPVYAVIAGSAESHCGKTNSLTAPSSIAQASLLVDAYRKAGIKPETITYVEAHGTGTVLGDPIEVNGLKNAFETLRDRNATGEVRHAYCGLGSIKSNIGHLESAAGIAGMVKVALALQHRTLPPTVNFSKINPYIDLRKSPFYIVDSTRPWDRPGDHGDAIRRGSVSSFGFGGSSAHVILEEYDGTADVHHAERQCDSSGGARDQVVVLSAKTESALRRYVAALCAFLLKRHAADPALFSIGNIAHTLRTGRAQFPVRLAVVANSTGDLLIALEQFLENREDSSAFFFSGDLAVNTPDGAGTIVHPEVIECRELAKRWAGGCSINWNGLQKETGSRKIHLPAYVFDKHPFSLRYEQTRESGSEYAPVDASEDLSEEVIVAFLKNKLLAIYKVPEMAIDINGTFYDMGLKSIDIINLLGMLARYINREIPSSTVYDHPTISSLARYLTSQSDAGKMDLRDEVYLDSSIAIGELPDAVMVNRNILLTGATGFLGAHLIYELMKNTDAVIYCLVRARDASEGLMRVRENLESIGLSDGVCHDRIRIIPGDVSQFHFGLDDEMYGELAGRIDTIYHCAAVVDWMMPYIALKKTNVDGTREMLSFACCKRVKFVNYISSTSVLPIQEGRLEFAEKPIENPEGIIGGYGQSKWVAEQLCFLAQSRGLPVIVYRFDFAVGSYDRGILKDTDFIIRLIKGCVELQCLPEDEFIFNMLPTDTIARMLYYISSDSANYNKIYHLFHIDSIISSEVKHILQRYNYKVNDISYENWKTLVANSPDNPLYPLTSFIEHFTHRELAYHRTWKLSFTNAMYAIFRKNPRFFHEMPAPGMIIERVISYMEEQGLLKHRYHNMLFDDRLFYWRKAGEEGSNGEPTGGDPGINPDDYAGFTIDIRKEMMREAFAMAEEYHFSILEFVMAVIVILLYRYNLRSEATMVMPIAETSEKDAGITRLLLPIRISGSIAGLTLIRKLHVILEDAYAERLISPEIVRDNVAAKNRRYDCLVCMQSDQQDPAVDKLSLNPHAVQDISLNSNIAYAISLGVQDMRLTVMYNREVFNAGHMENMTKHFVMLFTALMHNIDSPLYNLQYAVNESF